MTNNNTPLEAAEQQTVVEWLNLNGLKHTMIPNDTYTKSIKQKMRNKRLGLNPGLPDLLILIPKDKSKDGEGYAIFCEMKRAKKSLSTVSKAQQEWHDAINGLNCLNVQAYICYGAAEAIKVISHYLKSSVTSPF